MTKLQDKQEEFVSELNERLPRGVYAQYRESQAVPPWHNVLNVLIYGGNTGLQLFGLVSDKDSNGNDEVFYFENSTGRLY